MKHFFSFLASALMLTLGFGHAYAGNTATAKITVDDPSRVEITLDGVAQTLVAGDNTFSSDENRVEIHVGATEGNLIVEILQKTNWGENPVYLVNGGYTITLNPASSWNLNQEYKVTSSSLADFRNAKCYVTVTDDPTKVRLQRSKDAEPFALSEGVNEVAFSSEYENILSLMPQNFEGYYNLPLYKVLVNGTQIKASSNYSNEIKATVKDGDLVEITAAWPNTTTHVNFAFPNETNPEVIASVVNSDDSDSPIAFDATGFDVKCGTHVQVNFNKGYELSEVKVNGEVKNLWGAYSVSALVEEECTISVEGAPFVMRHVGLNVDDPSHLKVYRGSDWEGDLLTLNAGDNTIELTPNNATLTIIPQMGCTVESLVDETGADELANQYDASYIQLYDIADGKSYTITTGVKTYANHMAFFNNSMKATDYDNWSRNDNSESFSINHNGYTIVGFNDYDYPASGYVSTQQNATYIMMLNDAEVPNDGGWYFQPADGDVAYIFAFYEGEDYAEGETPVVPAKVNVSFEGVAGMTVTRDLIVPVENWGMGFEAYPGTSITIESVYDETVTVNGTPVEPNAEGKFEITVPNVDATIVVGDVADGIANMKANGKADSEAVYNLQGVRVNRTGKGIYVVNGKKMAR